jgi:hypothetical protein
MYRIKDTETNRIMFSGTKFKTIKSALRYLRDFMSPDLTKHTLEMALDDFREITENCGYKIYGCR